MVRQMNVLSSAIMLWSVRVLKIIGNVKIADNIKIAAGAVVVNSFMEPGITIAGIPARKINKN